MAWMNEADIDFCVQVSRQKPILGMACRFLSRLRDATNRQSDGWAYWPKPSRAAAKLQAFIQKYGGDKGYAAHLPDAPDEKEFLKTIPPIRAMVTREKKTQAARGNTFDFDVDAALAASQS